MLTDADMPAIESLGTDSDYSPFMSPGVSEELRRKALQKLFRLPQFSQRDPLDGEYYDCHGYEPLGDVITYDMREEMAREAQKLKEAEAQLAESAKDAAPASSATNDEAKPAVQAKAAVHRHSSHLRKRTSSAKKRSSSR